MTEIRTYETPSRVGRNKEFEVRITLPLDKEMAEGIDAARKDGEPRVDFIREAIARELKRRKREAGKKPD